MILESLQLLTIKIINLILVKLARFLKNERKKETEKSMKYFEGFYWRHHSKHHENIYSKI